MTETPDQARTRRRWISLAEFVAVAGLVVAALTLWNNWSDRRAELAGQQQAAAAAAREKARFELRGTVDNGRVVTLQRDDAHALSEVQVSFPRALGIAPKDAVDHRIEADWFADALLKATDRADDAGEGRLPVLVRYTYLTDDVPTTRAAIYEIVWRTEGRFLRGRAVTIADFRRREAAGSNTAARLDTLWAAEAKRLGLQPTSSSGVKK